MDEAIQLIDEQKRFHSDYWDYFKKCTGDRTVGLGYHVISVFGSQSSGKSTLLNTLFHTKFDTMDAQFKRQQTTKGIWLAHTRNVNTLTKKDANGSNADIFVLDVEGSDGAERGEDQDFERKAALFAISVSEVLIVNMWEQQIGLYQGNNMALLKTVFEVNLSLFGKNTTGHKVLLLFVIRDHVGVTPLQSLSDSLRAELEKIWADLNKPAECSNSSLYDFFDLEFTGLAHKLLQPKEFEENVKQLGDCFVYQDNEPYYFKKEYHHNLPLEGWTMYSENCWEQIENNKDLDLPTQQILVSTFKTEEIANEAFNNFEQKYNDEVHLVIKDKTKLIETLNSLKESCLNEYDEQACRYTKSVYLAKREDLAEKMIVNFTQTVQIFLDELSKQLFQRLTREVTDKKNKDSSFSQRSKGVSVSIKDEFKDALDDFGKNELLASSEEFMEQFDELLAEEIKRLSDEEIKSIITKAYKNVTLVIKEDTIRLLSDPEKDVWDCILKKFEQTIKDALKKYAAGSGDSLTYDFQVGLSEEENNAVYRKIRHNSWHLLNVTVHDYLKEDTVVGILRERFEKKFRYDDNDSPKLWKNEEEIDQAFRLAREYATEVLNVLSLATTSDNVEIVAEFDEEDDDEDEYYKDDVGIYHSRRFAHILNELQKEKILQHFRRQINITVLDSKRSIIKTTTSIPVWIYILIVVLGWNEFMIVIRNPLFVTLALISIVGFYFVNKFGLWGPVLNVAQSAVGETRSTMKAKLREFVLDSAEKNQTPVLESYEMEDMSNEKEN
ncbi:hypothetical protein HG535_0G02590 [Zygotorulaspora mrakii]|uniref:GB1/RHD3-type G domain-containing protein n=1 Tax=Zygotorulaspora mrakii TaxID=42260 RepID=A0A7H9B7N0_ZYGMR|nr:uncharacterized protein HG535_0G02590 [Zygotorulaspora mrakii]QLG74376.1 hypothetical protein HG535_0G02590 [Zygotorulaspora mrakii]